MVCWPGATKYRWNEKPGAFPLPNSSNGFSINVKCGKIFSKKETPLLGSCDTEKANKPIQTSIETTSEHKFDTDRWCDGDRTSLTQDK